VANSAGSLQLSQLEFLAEQTFGLTEDCADNVLSLDGPFRLDCSMNHVLGFLITHYFHFLFFFVFTGFPERSTAPFGGFSLRVFTGKGTRPWERDRNFL
jgi:hypothetical protein